MNNATNTIATDTWIKTSWTEYIKLIEDPAYEKLRSYYYKEYMRLEMLPVGHDHAEDDATVALIINLFCITQGIALKILSNCSYRRTGLQECQPDISCYFEERTKIIPRGTSIIDLDRYAAPDLVIEVSSTTLLDDLGIKRSLYEELGVKEYWIIDVHNSRVFAYKIINQGSQKLEISQVLPGLTVELIENALTLSRQTDQSTVGIWLLEQLKQKMK